MFFFIYYWCSNIFEFAWSNFSLASLRLFSFYSIFDCNYFDLSFNYSRSMSTFWSLSSRELFAKEISSFSFYTARRFSLVVPRVSEAALISFSLSKILRSLSINYLVLMFISPLIISIVFCNFWISLALIWFCYCSSCFYWLSWAL
jgi:hypothetical protein